MGGEAAVGCNSNTQPLNINNLPARGGPARAALYTYTLERYEIYPDVVDGLEEVGGVPSRLIKTDAGDGRQEGTPWEMFVGSMWIAPMRSRSRWMISREKVRVA